MKQNRQILLPVDFDDVSDMMLKLAFSLAKSIDATITLFNVVNDRKISDVNFAPVSEKIEALIKNGDLQKANYQFVIKKGVPESEILKYSEQNGVFLIIMETRVKQEKQKELIGSITAEVIDASKVPVMVIPKGTDIVGLKNLYNVGLATSMRKFDDLTFQNFMEFMDTFPDLKFELTMVHIQEKGEDASNYEKVMKQMDAYVAEFHKGIKTSYAIIPLEKSISSDLITYFQNSPFSMLVVKNNLRSIFTRLFKTSTTKKLVYHAQVPLLVFPNDTRTLSKLKLLH